MTIEMYCDRCGESIPADVIGGCRTRTGKKEFTFQLCAEHQKAFRAVIEAFCEHAPPRDVQPSLKGGPR